MSDTAPKHPGTGLEPAPDPNPRWLRIVAPASLWIGCVALGVGLPLAWLLQLDKMLSGSRAPDDPTLQLTTVLVCCGVGLALFGLVAVLMMRYRERHWRWY